MIPFLLAALGGYLIGDSMKNNQTFADGGEIRRFDRHEQMDDETRGEILDTINEFYLIDGFRNLQNYLYGLFDGYDYSQTDSFIETMKKLKVEHPALHNRIKNIYSKIDNYSFTKMAKGGETSFGDEFYIIIKTPKGLVTQKDYYGMGYNKKELIELFEGKGLKYNQKGEKFGGQALEQYEFFLKKPTKYDIQLPKKMAKGGSIGVDKASNGFKKKFVWVKEQNGVATELLQQKSFEEDFKELSNSSRFKLIRDDKGMKVFDDNVSWRITYRLKPIFAYGGQLELDFEPEEQIDESTLKARRYVELQNLANEEIELFGEIEDDTMKEIEELGESLNSHEVELVMEMYNKKKFAKGGVLDKKMYVVEIYSIESDDEGDDDTDLQKYTLRVAATDEGDAIDSAESLFVEEYGAMPIFSAKVVNSFDNGGIVKLSDFNPQIHDEEISIISMGYDYARVQFDLVYADDSFESYLLDYDIDRRDYDWYLEKVYRLENGKKVEEFLKGSPEFKAIQYNKFVIEAVDDKIGEALNN